VTPAPTLGALPAAFGTSHASKGDRAVRLAGPEEIPGLPVPSRTLIQIDRERALVDAGGRLWRVGPGPALLPLSGSGAGPVRVLAAGATYAWLAASAADGDRLLRVDATGAPQTIASLPRGLEARVASADGERIALTRRELEGDQVFLHEPATGATRLLLPDDRPGRFEPMAFSADAARLLLVADDRRGTARLEWLDLRDGSRRELPSGDCEVAAARLRGDDALAVETRCRGRAGLVLIEAGAERSLPTTADGRAVAAWPDGPSGWLYAVASPRHPRDLWRLEENGDARPIVFGLAPRVDPADLVDPEPVEVATPGGGLAAELWRPRAAPGERTRGGVVWLDREEVPARWFEFDPILQFLAQRGLAVLRLRLPPDDGGDARALLDRALATLRERTELGAAPVALVGLGARSASVAAAADRGGPFAAVAALDDSPGATFSRSDDGGSLLRLAPVPAPPPESAEEPDPSEAPTEESDAPAVSGGIAPTHLPSEVAAALWRHLSEHLAGRPEEGSPRP